MPRVSLAHEALPFLYCFFAGIRYDLIKDLGPFSVILQPLNFVALNLPFPLVLAKQQEKSQNTLIFRLLTEIWIIQIYDILLVLRMFKSGKFFVVGSFLWLNRYTRSTKKNFPYLKLVLRRILKILQLVKYFDRYLKCWGTCWFVVIFRVLQI